MFYLYDYLDNIWHGPMPLQQVFNLLYGLRQDPHTKYGGYRIIAEDRRNF